MTKRLLFLVPCVLAAQGAHAEDTALDRGYRQMYNLQFAQAHRTFAAWSAEHPEDPVGPASDAAAWLFAEFDRLHILQSEFFTHDRHFITDHKLAPDPEVKREFQAAIGKSRALSGRRPNDADAMFATILCNGLESDYLALIEKRYAASFGRMKASREMADRLLATNPDYFDAWIAMGIENYMLSIKPAPIRWLLRLGGGQTDRATGLAKIRLTAEKGRYLSPFAKLLLAVAALRDQQAARAKDLLAGLAREYPQNPLYREELDRLNAAEAGGLAR